MRVEVDGKHFDVPDDATPAEIDAISRLTPQDTHGMLAKGAHYAAKALPLAGGIAGGMLGAGAGMPTGPGAIATGAVGAGLLGAAGRAGQHAIDQALGYEKPMTAMQALPDVAATGAKEAALTGATGMGLEIASRFLPGAAAVARGGARALERRILTNKTNPFGKAKPISPEALDEAAQRGAFRFGGTSGGAANRLEGIRSDLGDEYRRIVTGLEAQGVTGEAAQTLAAKQIAAKANASATTMNPAVPGIYQSAADMIATKPTQGGLLTLSQMEEMKRSAQGMARSAYKQMQPTEVGKAHEAVASTMRQATEDAIAQQSAKAPDLAAQFGPAKQHIGNIIEASDLAREGMRAAGKRNLVTPSDLVTFAGELAHSGNPVKAAGTSALVHLLRSRGPSTAAVTLRGASNLANALSQAPQAVPVGAALAGPAAGEAIDINALLAAIRRKSTPAPALAANQ